MSTAFGAAGLPAGLPVEIAPPIAVHTCSRLGRTANPPRSGLSLTGWLRPRRRH